MTHNDNYNLKKAESMLIENLLLGIDMLFKYTNVYDITEVKILV